MLPKKIGSMFPQNFGSKYQVVQDGILASQKKKQIDGSWTSLVIPHLTTPPPLYPRQNGRIHSLKMSIFAPEQGSWKTMISFSDVFSIFTGELAAILRGGYASTNLFTPSDISLPMNHGRPSDQRWSNMKAHPPIGTP